MRLINVYDHDDCIKILWDLLSERASYANISHKAMPTYEQHIGFVAAHPFEDWCFIVIDEGTIAGAVYLTPAPRQPSTHGNEIGVFVFQAYQGAGYGPAAVKMMMDKHGPRRFLANIAPGNERSAKMFEKMGFKLAQHTYEMTA